MNGIEYALLRIHSGEKSIVADLMRIAERHHAEHEVHHVARDLADWSSEHVRRLADHATRYGLRLDSVPDSSHASTEKLRATVSVMTGRRPEPAIQLLEDLAELYRRASDNSLAWEMLAQIAQAQHEKELLAITAECHPQNLRQIRWANTMIKTLTPQALSSL